MAFPSLKLTYFDMAGRAETVRLALAIGGVPFQDERWTHAQFAAMKQSLPFKKLPLLTVDGQVLCQSHAMARYAATLAGLYPTNNPLEAFSIDEIFDFTEDVLIEYLLPFTESAMDKRLAKCDELASTKLPDMVAMLDARLALSTSSGPWFLDAISLADLSVYSLVVMFKSSFLQRIPSDLCDKFTNVMAIYDAVRRHPNVVAWYEAHKKEEP
ncbi:unnamed protein product [Aphanomyces euteiches]|uniref:Glutathione S-transferase n=1 Tax=Aphanomyces euteiches TaxID=100861 RepID=A0A6G0WEL7_9STRA|nr:hypothetical protein Ae201684_016091 [Aphanomyces euteiches]KAH9078155.1 hypothetical protein Ae201684P_019253 [Aphanomyces euteiches]